MMADNAKVIVIVGAGLSGLTCALELSQRSAAAGEVVKLIVLEGRNRIGGRLYGENGVDLGAAWSWPSNDRELTHLVRKLGKVAIESQYQTGNVLQQQISSGSGDASIVVAGTNKGPAGNGSTRFAGGVSSIVSRIEYHLLNSNNNVQIILSTRVTSVQQTQQPPPQKNNFNKTKDWPIAIEAVNTVNGQLAVFNAHALVLAMPPRIIATRISFLPVLPMEKLVAMVRTPTWMENTGKVGFIYSSPFWRVKGLSGTAFSRCGPLSQVWDNSAADGSVYALCGLVFGDTYLKYLKDDKTTLLSSPIMKQIVSFFGPEASEPLDVVFKSWVGDTFTSTSSADASSTVLANAWQQPPLPFGTPTLSSLHLNVVFAGTETAPNEHGHMNGAVVSANRAASEVMGIIGN